MTEKIPVALVGLGFGGVFVPSYLHHPNVESLTLCDTQPEVLNAVGDRYEISRRTTNFNDILNDDDIDAVHLVSPIPLHAQQTVAVLKAGKHCACTVPMATSLEDLREIVETQRQSGKNYMGMETAVYTRVKIGAGIPRKIGIKIPSSDVLRSVTPPSVEALARALA